MNLYRALRLPTKVLPSAQDIVNTLRESVIVLSPDLRVVTANPAFYKTFTLTKKETEGRYIYELDDGQWNIPELRNLLAKILPEDAAFADFEVEHTFPGIGYKVMSVSAQRIDLKELIMVVFEDITARKQLERQKDYFVGVVSHELKTPLTSAKVYSQVLESRFKKAGEDTSVAMLVKMDEQLDRLITLINDLLDATKIEAGKLQLQREIFNFDTTIAEIVEEVQRTTSTHTLLLAGKTHKNIRADKERLQQVLTNLLTNAIKYSPNADKIIITLSTTPQYVQVCVEDFGMGIPQEQQIKIFEQFYREGGKKETGYPGLGLGLFIAKEIITTHGGNMWVESEEGKGSRFYFTLSMNMNIIVAL